MLYRRNYVLGVMYNTWIPPPPISHYFTYPVDWLAKDHAAQILGHGQGEKRKHVCHLGNGEKLQETLFVCQVRIRKCIEPPRATYKTYGRRLNYQRNQVDLAGDGICCPCDMQIWREVYVYMPLTQKVISHVMDQTAETGQREPPAIF